MTGAVLGGADVHPAARPRARLQMTVMFMTLASNALPCMAVALFTLYVCVDPRNIVSEEIASTVRVLMHSAAPAAMGSGPHWLYPARVDYPYGHREANITEGRGS